MSDKINYPDLIYYWSSNSLGVNNGGDLPIGILILVVFAVVLFKKISNLNISELAHTYETMRKRNIIELVDRLNNKNENDDSYMPLKEKIEAYDFKLATGIYTNEARRKRLIELHRMNPKINTWERINSAMKFMGDDDSIRDFTKRDVFEKKSYTLLGHLCEVLAVISLLFTGLLGVFISDTNYQELIWLGYTIIFAFAGVFFHRQNWPYISAEKIKTVINNTMKHNSEN